MSTYQKPIISFFDLSSRDSFFLFFFGSNVYYFHVFLYLGREGISDDLIDKVFPTASDHFTKKSFGLVVGFAFNSFKNLVTFFDFFKTFFFLLYQLVTVR